MGKIQWTKTSVAIMVTGGKLLVVSGWNSCWLRAMSIGIPTTIPTA